MYIVSCEGGIEADRVEMETRKGEMWLIVCTKSGKRKEFRKGLGIQAIYEYKREVRKDENLKTCLLR